MHFTTQLQSCDNYNLADYIVTSIELGKSPLRKKHSEKREYYQFLTDHSHGQGPVFPIGDL